jgi:hypothetical protein
MHKVDPSLSADIYGLLTLFCYVDGKDRGMRMFISVRYNCIRALLSPGAQSDQNRVARCRSNLLIIHMIIDQAEK